VYPGAILVASLMPAGWKDLWDRKIVRNWRIASDWPVVAAAIIWRRLLRGPLVIGVTGSVGKTNCTRFLAAILSSLGPTVTNGPGRGNARFGLPRLVLSLRNSTRFAAVEMGVTRPGHMWRSTLTVKPQAAVITAVGRQHTDFVASKEQTAYEKAKILERFGPDGWAALNADDPLVSAMGDGASFEVIRYGTSEGVDVRGEVIPSPWPERFQMDVHADGRTRRIRTQLLGDHWVPSLLGAITAGLRCGATLDQCAEAVQGVEPFMARMQPMRLPSGAVLVRDEWNAAYDCWKVALEWMRNARAKRKIIVMGVIREAPDCPEDPQVWLGKSTAAAADLCLCYAKEGEKIRAAALAAGASPESFEWFRDQKAMAARLREIQREGDLILLRGQWWEHLSKVYFRQFGETDCGLHTCYYPKPCDRCPDLRHRPDSGSGAQLVPPPVPLNSYHDES